MLAHFLKKTRDPIESFRKKVIEWERGMGETKEPFSQGIFFLKYKNVYLSKTAIGMNFTMAVFELYVFWNYITYIIGLAHIQRLIWYYKWNTSEI